MDLLAELKRVLPEDRVATDGDEVERHGTAIFTYHASRSPDAVVFPQSRDEVIEILRFANERGVPIVPFGEGSSLEAHTIPVQGGISLDLG
ncbi:MAG: FAD-binding protein, partial [Actinomycetota bacterium]|nr:FAD-binding protein [Actinomycetota bacterium]